MTRFRIRAARRLDIDAILSIETASFATDRLSRRSLTRLLAAPSAWVRVATADGTIAGYALVLFRRRASVARLYSIAVASTFRGKGLAGRLLAEAEGAARRRGCSALRLEVRADNPAALHLYGGRGYTEIGRIAGYYADGMDAFRLEKSLRTATGQRRP